MASLQCRANLQQPSTYVLEIKFVIQVKMGLQHTDRSFCPFSFNFFIFSFIFFSYASAVYGNPKGYLHMT